MRRFGAGIHPKAEDGLLHQLPRTNLAALGGRDRVESLKLRTTGNEKDSMQKAELLKGRGVERACQWNV